MTDDPSLTPRPERRVLRAACRCLALAGAAALAACTAKPTPFGPPAPPPAPTVDPRALVWALAAAPTTPAAARAGTDEAAIQVAAQVNDGLFRYREDGSFDLVIGNHLLEHVDDPACALREFSRVLRPGGLLVAQTPYSPLLKKTFELKGRPGPEFAALFYGQSDHVRLFADDIGELFRGAGFEGELLPHDTVLPQVQGIEAGVNVREPFFVFNKPAEAVAA
jgi:SAM-dependent methyltransferase